MKAASSTALRVRVAAVEDAASVQRIYAPYVTRGAVSFEYTPPTTEQMAARMAALGAQFPWLMCLCDGQVAGYAYASRVFERAAYQWDASVTVYVDASFARRGVGATLYTVLEDCLKKQGYVTLYACITAANTASCAFHEKRGYTALGLWPAAGFKNGAWHDICWYHKRLCALPAQPQPPIPFADLPMAERHPLLQC